VKRVGVMHIIDSLEIGGAERMAVYSVNNLARTRYQPFLCVTRHAGPLLRELEADVGLLKLGRKRTLDVRAFARMCNFIYSNGIQILHAHSTSLFLALAAARFGPRPAVVWHMHYGGSVLHTRHEALFGFAARRTAATIAVTSKLSDWAASRLGVPSERLFYIPNFAVASAASEPVSELPGTMGSRIVCVANIRAEKDQLTLVRAMQIVAAEDTSAHLVLVGGSNDSGYADAVRAAVSQCGLESRVTLLGARLDVPQILAACDIAVLSSAIEGLPLALIEYGAAGLPAVATNVGQCEEVLDHGNAGIVVPPSDPQRLADALLGLLSAPEHRARLGARLRARVQERYSANVVMAQFSNVYDEVLARN
jgi:glycosyltransferase involved in cell wall biosynthesis